MDRMGDVTLGKRIRSCREQKGMTQEGIAEALSVSRQAVSKWEADLSRPSTDNLIRLARVFEVELQDLLGDPRGKDPEAPQEAGKERGKGDLLGDSVPGEASPGEMSLGETSLEETSLGETSLGETSLGETSLEGIPLGEAPLGEARETPAGESPRNGDYGNSQEEPSPGKRSRVPWGAVLAGSALTLLLAAGILGGIWAANRPGREFPEKASGEPLPQAAGISGQEDVSQAAGISGQEDDSQAAGASGKVSSTGPSETSQPAALPVFLTVSGQESRALGDSPGRDEVVEAASVQENVLFTYRFPDSEMQMVFYREQSELAGDEGEPLWHLMAAYDQGDGYFRTIARIAEDEPQAGSPRITDFEALGYRGCKAEILSWRFNVPSTYYFVLSAEGVPTLWGVLNGPCAEADLDADGEREILSLEDPWSEKRIFDRGVEGYTAYVITDPLPEGYGLTYGRLPDTYTGEEGIVLTAPDGTWAAYRHLWDGRLTREAVPCSGAGQEGIDPQVAATVLTFVGLQEGGSYPISDGTDPDLPYEGREDLPTHRQLAYLGLQALYDLTGITLERCFVQADSFGVCFNEEPNFDGQGFYCFDRGARWGTYENAIGGLTVSWRQKYVEYSPLDPAQAKTPQGDWARWTYEQIPLLWEGEIVSVGSGLGEDQRLFLEDGRFFEVSFDEGTGLPARIQGPYPKGFEH